MAGRGRRTGGGVKKRDREAEKVLTKLAKSKRERDKPKVALSR